MLLQIEQGKVDADIREENLDGGSDLFPHIYGPLPVTAVVSARRLGTDSTGRLLIGSE